MNKKKKNVLSFSFFLLLFFVLSSFFVWASEDTQKIEKIEAVSSWKKIEIIWEKNEYLSETQSLVLVRKKDGCPRNISDGEELYRGNGFQFVDKDVRQGEKYCYGVGLLELSGSSSDFLSSQSAESLDFFESLGAELEDGSNLLMFFEVVILVLLACVGKWKKNKLARAKEKLVLRKL